MKPPVHLFPLQSADQTLAAVHGQSDGTRSLAPVADGSVSFRGNSGSPYTHKMLALLRYRRIPYRLLTCLSPPAPRPQPKVALLPTFYLPDSMGELRAVVDSTPLIRRFEEEFVGRHVLPGDPALRFFDALLEDFADEWLTKAMFHYRWQFQPDSRKAQATLPLDWTGLSLPDDELERMCTAFGERQASRVGVVGSNESTSGIIESSFRRIVSIMDACLQRRPFLLGNRPGASDFAFYGQLSQLAQIDPTPAAIALRLSPRVVAWVSLVSDLGRRAHGR